VVGFYSYGELSPVSAGTCDLHNQTMTITVFRSALHEQRPLHRILDRQLRRLGLDLGFDSVRLAWRELLGS